MTKQQHQQVLLVSHNMSQGLVTNITKLSSMPVNNMIPKDQRPPLHLSFPGTEGCHLIVVHLIIFQLYDDMKAICIQKKQDFKLWILIYFPGLVILSSMLGSSNKPQHPVSQATMKSKEYFLSSSTIRDPNALEHGQLQNLVGMVQESCWTW